MGLWHQDAWDPQVGKALRNHLEKTHFLNVKWSLRSKGESLSSDHIDLTLSPERCQGLGLEKERKPWLERIEWVCEWEGLRWLRRPWFSA